MTEHATGIAAGTVRRCVIVTGGSSGIGEASARGLAAAGCDVGITYRENRDGATKIVTDLKALGVNAVAVELDLAKPELVEPAIEGLVSRLGRVDVLVNNAGTNRRAGVLDEDVAGWERTLAVNLIGPSLCSKAAAKHMISQGAGGRIINITSILAFTVLSQGGAYCASKAGLELLTKVMALELAPHGITVNAVAPGHTATPLAYNEDEMTAALKHRPVIPVGRAAAPAEIAQAVVVLASPEAGYTTGASLLVDGGLLLASGPESLEQAVGLPPADG